MGILIFIIVGAIAGFVASKVISGKGMGLLWDIVAGILGAFLGAWLAGLVGLGVDRERSPSAASCPPSWARSSSSRSSGP